MLKNWKNLFVKSEEEEQKPETPKTEKTDFSFPVNNNTGGTYMPSNNYTPAAPVNQSEAINEVIGVYEKGLDSINMPGYDFYEFYKGVSGAGQPNEQMYNMAFNMAKTMDSTLTIQKLLQDAEFYISKINDVHSTYNSKGQQKLNSINQQKGTERSTLSGDIDRASIRLAELKAEIQRIEADIIQKKDALAKIDGTYMAEEAKIRETLSANDIAKQTSIDKLNRVKDAIRNFIK